MVRSADPRPVANRGASNGSGGSNTRSEPRRDVVRLVEYAPFPRVHSDQRQQVGFTRDLSRSGLCLRVDAGEPPGSLLRIVLRSPDGRPASESVARVAWCSEGHSGGWLGLQIVARRPKAAAQ